MSDKKDDWLFGASGLEGIRSESERLPGARVPGADKAPEDSEAAPKPSPEVDRSAETEVIDLDAVDELRAQENPSQKTDDADSSEMEIEVDPAVLEAAGEPLLSMDIVPGPLDIDIPPAIAPLGSSESPPAPSPEESFPQAQAPQTQAPQAISIPVDNPFAAPVPEVQSEQEDEELEAIDPAEAAAMLGGPSDIEMAPTEQLSRDSEELPALSQEELLEMMDSRASKRPAPQEAPVAESLSRDSEELEAISPEEAAAMLGMDSTKQAPGPKSGTDDLVNMVQENSKAITLRQLSKQGRKNVRMMEMKDIKGLVTLAIDKVLERRGEQVSESERARLESEAKKEFDALLKEHNKVKAEKSEVDRLNETLKAELEASMAKLQEENERHAKAGQAEFSMTSFDQMETHIRDIFKRLVNEETRSALALHGPQALPGLEALDKAISEMLSDLIERERDKAINEEQEAHKRRVEILEARIRKLNTALTDTEGALKKVAAMKQIDLGVASIYGDFQGLNMDDANFEKKSELLKTIFLENMELQGKEIDDEDREGTLEVEEPARQAPTLLELPEGFSAPLDVDALTGESAF